MTLVNLRFVEVPMGGANFAAIPLAERDLTQAAPLELADDEKVVQIETFYRHGGSMGSYESMFARVWIAS